MTEQERAAMVELRGQALQLACSLNPNGTADQILRDAARFVAFLGIEDDGPRDEPANDAVAKAA